MPAFAYQAVDVAGRRLRGSEEAPSAAALTRTLETRGLIVVELAEGAEAPSAGFRFGRRQAVLELTRAIAALLAAGLPLARALAAATHVTTGELTTALGAVKAEVERGHALSSALAEHPELFSPLYVGLVRAGERSGDLAAAFARLARQLEREEQLRARLLSLSIYPMILAVAGGMALLVLVLFVLPRFAELLTGSGADLPRSTAFVLAASAALRRFWPVLAAAVLAVPGFMVWLGRSNEGRRTAARVLLALPLVRELRQQVLAARFSRLVGVLLGGGAPLLAALDAAAESVGDPLAQEEADRIRARVREGASLHAGIAAGALFPPLFPQLVAVGEEAGRLEDFLLKAAELFEERTERGLQRLVTLIEPALIVGFGAIVALVALAVLQAIYGVNAGSFR